MKTQNLLYLLICCSFLFTAIACNQYDYNDYGSPKTQFEYVSITAGKYTLKQGESTQITVLAKGYKLKYEWTYGTGELKGTDSQVTYTAPECTYGIIMVGCTITDAYNNSQKQKIIFQVTQNL